MKTLEDIGISIWVQLVIILGITLLNGYFVMAKTALTSVNKDKLKALKKEGDGKSEEVLEFIEEPRTITSTVSVITTFIGILVSAFAAIGISLPLGNYMKSIGISYGREIAIILVTVVLSLFFLVIGKLYPESFAKQHSRAISRIVVTPMKILVKITMPFTWIAYGISGIFLIITRQQVNVKNKKLKADDKLAYEIMTPIKDISFKNIEKISKAHVYSENKSVAELFLQLKKSEDGVAFLIDEDNRFSGMITMKDLTDEIKKEGKEEEK